MTRPVVDYVICAHNNRHLIGATLEAIAGQNAGPFSCTLVDGQSTDGTAEFARERFPFVSVVVKAADTGPAHGRNVGYLRGSAEFVAFVDSDVVLEPGWAEAQLRLMRADEKLGMAGSCLLYAGQPELLYASHGVMSRYGVAWDGGRAQPAASFRMLRRCLWVNTSAVMVRRKLLDHVGGFDDAMYFGWEDSDLGWRSNLLGWRVVSNPSAVAKHVMHGTYDPGVIKSRLLHLIWRNRLRSLLVNYGPLSLVRYTSIFLLISAADAIVHSPRRAKLSALWWNLRQLPGTVARRRRVQRQRVVRDRDLWPLFQFGLRGPGYAFHPRAAHREASLS